MLITFKVDVDEMSVVLALMITKFFLVCKQYFFFGELLTVSEKNVCPLKRFKVKRRFCSGSVLKGCLVAAK